MGQGHAQAMERARETVSRVVAQYPDAGKGMASYARRYRLTHRIFGLPGDETADGLTETMVALADTFWLVTGLSFAGYAPMEYDVDVPTGRPDGYRIEMAQRMRYVLTRLARAYTHRDVSRSEYRSMMEAARRFIRNESFFVQQCVEAPPRFFA